MRRRTLLVALAGLAVVVAAGTVVLWPREDRLNEANFARITPGMSRAEVEAILGPAGDYSSGPLEFTLALFSFTGGTRPTRDYEPPSRRDFFGDGLVDIVEWRTDKWLIVIYFSPTGPLRSERHHVVRADQSVFENLLWRAKRQWRS
jgi:hypothetical protein